MVGDHWNGGGAPHTLIAFLTIQDRCLFEAHEVGPVPVHLDAADVARCVAASRVRYHSAPMGHAVEAQVVRRRVAMETISKNVLSLVQRTDTTVGIIQAPLVAFDKFQGRTDRLRAATCRPMVVMLVVPSRVATSRNRLVSVVGVPTI